MDNDTALRSILVGVISDCKQNGFGLRDSYEISEETSELLPIVAAELNK
jgi:hypothetical protein